jgi:hypothetical protein
MFIEFYTPERQVREWVINYTRERLAELNKHNKQISRAEVYFRDQGTNKVCEIDLTIYGDSLLVQCSADDYDKAARETLKEVEAKIKEQVKIKNQPPDELTSPVQV